MSENNLYVMADGSVINDEELSSMMESLLALRPHQSMTYTWDDIGIASLMSDLYKQSIRYCPQNDAWYIWDGCWRKQSENGSISDRLQSMLNLLLLYCKEIDAKEGDLEGFVAEYAKYIKTLRKYTPMRNIMEVLKTMVRMSLTEMDTNPYLLNTPSRAYDLKTGGIVDDITPFNVTKKTSCSLPTLLTTLCARWQSYIDEIMSHDREKAAFLQRALGYSLLGVNREECMFIAYGSQTRNGKGTLFSTIATVLGEDYADSAPVDLICEGKNGRSTDFNAAQPALAKLVGTRLVTMSESAKDVRLDAASLKTITGRDTLVTRGLYQNSFSFVPQFTLWLNTNHLPAVTDDTVFLSDRVWVIEFSEHFDKGAQDKDLKELFARPENRPTILGWLMEGCEAYMREGLNPPKCVVDATQHYRHMHDRIGSFIEECCVLGDDLKIQRGTLYSAYRTWCNQPDNRYKPMGSTSFYNEMAMRGHPVSKIQGLWYMRGIEVKSSD